MQYRTGAERNLRQIGQQLGAPTYSKAVSSASATNELTRSAASRQDAISADTLYDQAIKLDPKFTLALARGAIWNSMMFFVGRGPERKQKALSLVQAAQQLAPDLAEVARVR